jgi:hypothetical protein
MHLSPRGPRVIVMFVEIFFPFSANTWFFALIGLGLFLLFARGGRVATWYHLDLLMILAWVPLPDYEVGDLEVTVVLGWLPLFYWIPRLLWVLCRTPAPVSRARIGSRHLALLLVAALGYLVFLSLISPYPFGEFGERKYHLSDSAMMGYRGADRILDGQLPYTETVSRQSNFPYGPAYFTMYVPVAYFFPEADPYRSYCLGARLYAMFLSLVGASALFYLGRRVGDRRTGWAWALLWLASPYLHNSVYWAQASHILPGVLVALGLAAAHRSAWVGGAVLGLAASTAYYPVAFLPIWARASGRWLPFTMAFFGVVAAFFLPVVLAENGVERFLGHVTWIETATRPGTELPWSRYSPWYQHPSLIPLRDVLKLLFVVTSLFVYGWLFIVRRGSPLSLRTAAIASAAIVASSQAFKLHAPGRYHLWLFPLLLIPILWPADGRERMLAERDTPP